MKTEIHIEENLARITVKGRVATASECEQILLLLQEHAICTRPIVLWDTREATVHLGPDTFCRYARMFRQGMSFRPIERKVAALIGDPTTASLFLILKTLMAGYPTTYRIFQDESEAMAWLTSDCLTQVGG